MNVRCVCSLCWYYLLFLTILLASCTSSSSENTGNAPSEAALPNIIFILADDMGYGDIAALNPESGVPTPNMDRLVQEGIHFTDAHSNSSVCTPTRYGVLTGRYAWRSRLKEGVLWGYDPPLIENDRVTVASFLKAQGYHTACIGKWHLGLGWQKKNPDKPIAKYEWDKVFEKGADSNVDFSQPVVGGPADLGFDVSYIIPASLDMTPYVYLENNKVTELPTAYTEGRAAAEHGRGVFWRAGEVSPGFDFDNVLPHLTQKAVSYVQQQRETAAPFFLYFPLTAPHTPWLPTGEVEGVSEAGRYGDFVAQVDGTIGAILRALDEAGLAENTLIIVTSDNGAHWTEADKAEYAHRANDQFRGQKADIYEGGHHIPYMARWPAQIAAGSSSDQLIGTTDLLATLSGIVDQPLPAGAGEDSYDMLDAYLGKDTEAIRPQLVHHSLHGYFSLRQGKWKLTPHLGSGGFTDPVDNDPAEVRFAGTLYDIEADPRETNNLYNQHSEVRDSLMARLEAVKMKGAKR